MNHQQIIRAGLARRYRQERRFRVYGLAAIMVGLLFLLFLLSTTTLDGYSAFRQTYINLELKLSNDEVGYDSASTALAGANDANDLDYGGIIKRGLRARFPAVTTRKDRKALYRLLSGGAQYDLQETIVANPALIGTTAHYWLLADDEVDMYVKGRVDTTLPEPRRRLKDRSIEWLTQLAAHNQIDTRFNTLFFTAGDSREPEQAGIRGAVMGTFYTIFVAMLLAFPIGVSAAIYLQEFAAKNRLTAIIEVNINNLAAVPSIIFGLLGLAIFINYVGLPRSIPLVGGMVLALMTLPTIIISSRAAFAAVPPSIRDAALAIGASPVQTVLHHTLPLALPGILTGAIISLARAIGETAPLLVIGMVAFIVDIPHSPLEPATALPIQIYLWADSPERAFMERTSAAIMVLLFFLVTVNGLIVVLRKKLERRW